MSAIPSREKASPQAYWELLKGAAGGFGGNCLDDHCREELQNIGYFSLHGGNVVNIINLVTLVAIANFSTRRSTFNRRAFGSRKPMDSMRSRATAWIFTLESLLDWLRERATNFKPDARSQGLKYMLVIPRREHLWRLCTVMANAQGAT